MHLVKCPYIKESTCQLMQASCFEGRMFGGFNVCPFKGELIKLLTPKPRPPAPKPMNIGKGCTCCKCKS